MLQFIRRKHVNEMSYTNSIQIAISFISFFMDTALKSFYKMDLGLAFSFIRCIQLLIKFFSI